MNNSQKLILITPSRPLAGGWKIQ